MTEFARCGADECPTRQYPVPGPFRFDASPDWYAEADTMEKIAALHAKEIEDKWMNEVKYALVHGTGLYFSELYGR